MARVALFVVHTGSLLINANNSGELPEVWAHASAALSLYMRSRPLRVLSPLPMCSCGRRLQCNRKPMQVRAGCRVPFQRRPCAGRHEFPAAGAGRVDLRMHQIEEKLHSGAVGVPKGAWGLRSPPGTRATSTCGRSHQSARDIWTWVGGPIAAGLRIVASRSTIEPTANVDIGRRLLGCGWGGMWMIRLERLPYPCGGHEHCPHRWLPRRHPSSRRGHSRVRSANTSNTGVRFVF